MKKVSLLTLATATFISSMASAQMYQGNSSANMITPSLKNMENPMYKPMAGQFYSKTNLNYTPVSHVDDTYTVTEEFGYGISQDWAISAAIGYGWMDKDANFFDKESQLSNILGVLPDSPYIKDIANFLDEKNQQVSFPNFNIWADNIIYEEDKLFEK